MISTLCCGQFALPCCLRQTLSSIRVGWKTTASDGIKVWCKFVTGSDQNIKLDCRQRCTFNLSLGIFPVQGHSLQEIPSSITGIDIYVLWISIMVESSECVCVCEWANLPNWKLTDIAIEDLIYVTNKKPYVQIWPQSWFSCCTPKNQTRLFLLFIKQHYTIFIWQM